MMRRREMIRAAQSGGGGRLPDAYQEVEWIGTKSKTNNKLMTGVTPKAPVRIVTEYYFVSSGYRAFLLVDPAPYNIRYLESNGTGYYNWGNKQFGFTSPAYNTWHTLDASSTLIIDGVTVGTISGGTSDWTGNTVEYFFFQTSNSCTARVKETFVYAGDTLKADLVPCYRKSDGHIGWYDIVNDTFFGFADNSKAETGDNV